MAMKNQLSELRALAAKAQNRRTETGIPRVAMVRGAVPEHELAAVYDPMINLILQGSKSMTVGGRTLHYDPATYFVMSIDLPAVGSVHPSKTGEPYLAVSLTLDPIVIAGLLADVPALPLPFAHGSGFSVAQVTDELMDAWVRMLRLMKQPGDIPALAPVYEREILYRVLQGPNGRLLRDIATPDTAMARVNLAIRHIRERFDQFVRTIKEEIPPGTGVVLRGSAITGKRWRDGKPFDCDGPGTSDLDLTLVGDAAIGLFTITGFFVPGVHSRPLSDEDPKIAPDLIPLRETLMAMTGRPVNIQASRELVIQFRGDLLGQAYLTLIPRTEATAKA